MQQFVYLITLIFTLFFATSGFTEDNKVRLLVPGTPSSIPLIIAAQDMGNVDIKVVHNLAQAHALFIRGDADLIVSGLSVGMKFFNQGIPVKLIASHVASLSYLIYNRNELENVTSFTDLVGQKILFPFPGSPLEEVSRYFAKQEGLELGKDIEVGYSNFQSSVKMLRQGTTLAVALPEPFVSLALKDSNHLAIGLDFGKLWGKYNQSTYPQVVLMGKDDWLRNNSVWADQFKKRLAEAITLSQTDPIKAVNITQEYFALPKTILISALTRTKFNLQTDANLQQAVFSYYKEIGRDLDKQKQTQYDNLF